MTIEIAEFTDIPEGQHTGTLEKVEEGRGNFGPFRKWSWLVELKGENGETDIVPHMQYGSGGTGPRSGTFQILTALLGRQPKAGEKVEPPIGNRAVLTFGRNEKGYPKIVAYSPYVDPQKTLDEIPR